LIPKPVAFVLRNKPKTMPNIKRQKSPCQSARGTAFGHPSLKSHPASRQLLMEEDFKQKWNA